MVGRPTEGTTVRTSDFGDAIANLWIIRAKESERGMSFLKRVFLIIVIVGTGIFVWVLLYPPNLLDPPRVNYPETSAISSVRYIVSAQIIYSAETGQGNYAPDLAALLTEGLIDSVLGSGTQNGYTFRTLRNGEGSTFTITATPLSQDKRHGRSFYADETGVIRYTREDRPAWFKDTPLGQ